MKQTIGFTLSVLVTVLLLAILYSGPASGAAPDGKALFLAQKCNTCHNVPAAGIERTTKSEKMAGPDLVNIKVDAATLAKVLKRQADVDGKKHPKEFKGSDEELNAVITWILAQKK
ncbi:MAG TPA: cytochrome c [Thermoanaerobaculia bacterium]|nr:cytochrome c [Thermoanaerobaculia bacterium]